MARMEAAVFHEHGGPEVLTLEKIERPEPGPGEVRIAVRAVALNHLDLFVRAGGPAFKVKLPHRLGSEVAGTIDALGPGVSDLEVGARALVNPGLSCGHCRECLRGRDNLCRRYQILGEHRPGGYAQFLVIPRQNVAPYPERLSFEEAAATPLTFLTAWQMLVDKARVQPGETVLVQAAGSGVGVAAIQIARLFGARVLATAGTDEKLSRARELGADEVINYREDDFVAAVKELTGRRGVDLVFEHVGGEVLAKSIKATRNGGRIVTCGATAAPKSEIDLRHVFFRQISILGSTMGSKGALFEVLKHIESGAFEPVIDRVLPLSGAAVAHRLLEERKAFGKVVLTPS